MSYLPVVAPLHFWPSLDHLDQTEKEEYWINTEYYYYGILFLTSFVIENCYKTMQMNRFVRTSF